MPSAAANGMSTTSPLTGERSSRPVPLAADVYASCRLRFRSCGGDGACTSRSVSNAARPDTTETDGPTVVVLPGDKMAVFESCALNASCVSRDRETTSEAARPNDPAVSKEADKTAVTGSHLFGSMRNGFDRNLAHLVSTCMSETTRKNLRCEHSWFQYRCFDQRSCCSLG
jgi:hypothetical protein